MSDSVGVELETIRERAKYPEAMYASQSKREAYEDRVVLLGLLDEAVELIARNGPAMTANERAFLVRLGRDQ